MGFLQEVNEEKTVLKNQLAEHEHDQAMDLELERSKRVALQRRVDADEADRTAALQQVSWGKEAQECKRLCAIIQEFGCLF